MTCTISLCSIALLLSIYPAPIRAMHTGPLQNPRAIETADSLFKAGKFAEAEQGYRAVLKHDDVNFPATLRLGRLLLYSNRLSEAASTLKRAYRIEPENKEVTALLAETAYRKDDFVVAAAPLFKRAGRPAKAKQLESFAGLIPYEVENQPESVVVPFIHTDPLPLISVKVNGSQANFLIDTGGSEIILDPDFAKAVGAHTYGHEQGIYGGGRKAMTGLGRIDSIELGSLTVRNVPVQMLNTKPFSAAAQGKPVSGIVGTIFLYHFLPTLDYPNGRLILRPRSRKAEPAPGSVRIPFWLASDHLIIARGRVNRSPEHPLLVDTGLAGAAYTGPKSMLDEIGVKVSLADAPQSVGGGGKMPIAPFDLNRLRLGAAEQRRLTGIAGPFPESLEYSLGFRLCGIISHEFFLPYAVTFDFTAMQILLDAPTSTSQKADAPLPKLLEAVDFFVKSYNSGDYAAISAKLGAALSSALPPDRAKAMFEGLASQMGKIKSCPLEKLDNRSMGTFDAQFEHGRMQLQIGVDEQGHIAQLGLRHKV